jgi:hypothetical protein
MIMLSVSVAVVDAARAQIHPERPPGDGPTQALSGHQHPTRDELEKIDKDNRLLNLPASHDEITGAGQAPRLDGEIRDVCPGCGSAEDAAHQWSWSILQPVQSPATQDELRAMHQ